MSWNLPAANALDGARATYRAELAAEEAAEARSTWVDTALLLFGTLPESVIAFHEAPTALRLELVT